MSIQSVAEKAGVSVATVSRVFNFPDKVTPATRAHVERVASELGYLPNSSARTLRTQRSRVLGVVLPTLLNPVFAECLQGIAQAAVAGGYAIIPVTTGYRLDEEQRAVNLLLAGNVDGLILVVSNPATSAALRAAARRRHSLRAGLQPAPATIPASRSDNESAMADAVSASGRARAPPHRDGQRHAGRIRPRAAALARLPAGHGGGRARAARAGRSALHRNRGGRTDALPAKPRRGRPRSSAPTTCWPSAASGPPISAGCRCRATSA